MTSTSLYSNKHPISFSPIFYGFFSSFSFPIPLTSRGMSHGTQCDNVVANTGSHVLPSKQMLRFLDHRRYLSVVHIRNIKIKCARMRKRQKRDGEETRELYIHEYYHGLSRLKHRFFVKKKPWHGVQWVRTNRGQIACTRETRNHETL